MQNDPGDLDLSIHLQPVDERPLRAAQAERWPPDKPQGSSLGKFLIYGVICGGLLLAVGAIAAAIGIMVRIGADSTKNVVVTAQSDPASLRAESTSVFGAYDATQQSQNESSKASEHSAIDTFFGQIEKCAAEGSDQEFKQLVDFDRMMKRVERTGNLTGWTYFDKRTWRNQIKAMSDTEPCWGDITVAGIVTPHDDPSTRIVYAYCYDSATDSPSETRFWIANDGDSWKLYDWSRLDLGLAESQEWGLYARYANSPLLAGFERWGELIGEVDDAIGRNDIETAKQKLRRAETEEVPPELDDFHWVLTGFRWSSLGEGKEAERCYNNVRQPDETPGAHYGLLTCKRWDEPAAAIRHAERYEAAVGPCPHLLEVKAQLLNRLGRGEESAKEWRRLLRIKPDHAYAMSAFVSSLPITNEAEFEAQLDLLSVPTTSLASIARAASSQDYERALLLAKYVNRKSPDSPAAHYVAGLTRYLDGDYSGAAEDYHQAYEKEEDETQQQSYEHDYIEAMMADGKVIEAVKDSRDPKASIEQLYYNYEEEGLELTEDEFREVVTLHRKLYPNDIEAKHREAALAVTQERYEDAERMLRKALEEHPESAATEENAGVDEAEGDDAYYRNLCEALLATTLYNLDRWKEAYESIGERRERFSQLLTMAVRDKHWDVVQSLLELHRSSDPEDPKLHLAEGQVAAHEKRWDDAVRHFRQGLNDAEDYETWQLKHELVNAYVESGRWLEHFKTSSDQSETFKQLADQLAEDENWDAVGELIAAYREMSPDDIRLLQQEAVVAWHEENYGLYAQLARRLLHEDNVQTLGYERIEIEDRLLSALLRSRMFGQAWQLALTKQQKENNTATKAIVNAANGKLDEAQKLAMASARENEHAAVFYTDSDTARIFHGDEFSALHEEFPVSIPYDASGTLAVFVFEKPLQLDAEAIYEAMKKLEIEISATLQPIDSLRDKETSAFALKQGNATIWLAAGDGKFNDSWMLDKKQELTNKVGESHGWLAIGTAGLIEEDRRKAALTARRLGAKLADNRSVAVYIVNRHMWNVAAYPTNAELFAEWVGKGKVRSFSDMAAGVSDTPANSVAADREFDRQLYAAVRAFEATPGGRLEVISCVANGARLDPLRLDVKKVHRSYDSLEFEGRLLNDSVLVPELRAGLPMKFASHILREVRLNDGAAVLRQSTASEVD